MPRPRIMVVGGGGFSSRIIERAGFGPWSHMAALLADDSILDARDDEVGGQPSGVRIRNAYYLNKEPQYAIFESPLSGTYVPWQSVLVAQLGKPYDMRGIGDFAQSIFTGQYVDPNFAQASSKAWFCDALQAWAAVQSGDVPSPPPWFHYYAQTPTSALNLFLGAGWYLTGSKGTGSLRASGIV